MRVREDVLLLSHSNLTRPPVERLFTTSAYVSLLSGLSLPTAVLVWPVLVVFVRCTCVIWRVTDEVERVADTSSVLRAMVTSPLLSGTTFHPTATAFEEQCGECENVLSKWNLAQPVWQTSKRSVCQGPQYRMAPRHKRSVLC